MDVGEDDEEDGVCDYVDGVFMEEEREMKNVSTPKVQIQTVFSELSG